MRLTVLRLTRTRLTAMRLTKRPLLRLTVPARADFLPVCQYNFPMQYPDEMGCLFRMEKGRLIVTRRIRQRTAGRGLNTTPTCGNT